MILNPARIIFWGCKDKEECPKEEWKSETILATRCQIRRIAKILKFN
jgi:hypothetical protein